MKNTINAIRYPLLSLFLLFAMLQSTFAQDSTDTARKFATRKPSPGEFGIGIKAAGLKGLIWENSFDSLTIQLRKVQSQTIVLRTDLGVQFNNQSTSFKNVQTSGGYDLNEDSEKSLSIVLAPGLERHFKGTRRLDPFVGVALPLVFVGKTKNTSNNETVFSDGDYYKQKVERTTPGGFGFGLDGLIGVNYFVFNHLALGIEYQIGFSFVKVKGKETSKVTTRERINGGSETSSTTNNDGDEVDVNAVFFGNKGVLGLNMIFYFGSKS